MSEKCVTVVAFSDWMENHSTITPRFVDQARRHAAAYDLVFDGSTSAELLGVSQRPFTGPGEPSFVRLSIGLKKAESDG